ncbi:DUF2239 family protein [Polymorphobacter arshaanensis]|uniref:DUF2239 family protein n=1 Tax=Glacieibacterium arshaanense TaxID=2511025 RepID=A0A4Y9EPI8_9SPHN|nr:DUF2239 family protein [Polymorphobacter arshaanensis]TFU03630.1 DUF2239 family protein [Polymorphobacter arshaanensis]
MDTDPTYTIFAGDHCLGSGTHAAALQIIAAQPGDGPTVLVFADTDGRQTELDALPEPVPRGRGRPKLGVTAREVTLLPRHWDWLAAQPGGASVALRRLVESARRSDAARARSAQEAAYRFINAIAGNQPGHEEALRALFANDLDSFAQRIAAWPADIRGYALKLAGAAG